MDDPNVNVPADIYRNIRNKALEEAAKICEDSDGYTDKFGCAGRIRALKVEE